MRQKMLQLITAGSVIAGMLSGIPVQAAETQSLSDTGYLTTPVTLSIEDAYSGSNAEAETFTVTIPKSIELSDTEETSYEITVEGTIHDNSSVWVCVEDTLELSLDTENSQLGAGLASTLTATQTVPKNQFSSTEIATEGGYVTQNTFEAVGTGYEVLSNYNGSMTFYIGITNEDNLIPLPIMANGNTKVTDKFIKQCVKDVLPAEMYAEYEASDKFGKSLIPDNYNITADGISGILISYTKGLSYSQTQYEYIVDIYFAQSNIYYANGLSSIIENKSVQNGKYIKTYQFDTANNCQNVFWSRVIVKENVNNGIIEEIVATSSTSVMNAYNWKTVTDNGDTQRALCYITPRCKYITIAS